VFGSDSPWYGGPQWQIEALWRFEIPEDMARQYGYPRLTEGAKRKILGLNSARLYKLAASGNVNEHGQGNGKGLYKPFPGDYVERIPESLKTLLEFPGFTADNFTKARMAYQDWKGAAPRHTRFGWIRNQA